jgi:hypothetical protein
MTCGTMSSWMGAVEMLWTYFSHRRLLFINDKVYTMDEKQILLALIIGTVYIFKDKPICGFIWRTMTTFLLMVFLILTANFVKDEVKKWWQK